MAVVGRSKYEAFDATFSSFLSIDERLNLWRHAEPSGLPKVADKDSALGWWAMQWDCFAFAKRYPNAKEAEPVIKTMLYESDRGNVTPEMVKPLNAIFEHWLGQSLVIYREIDLAPWASMVAPHIDAAHQPKVLVVDARGWQQAELLSAVKKLDSLPRWSMAGRLFRTQVDFLVSTVRDGDLVGYAIADQGISQAVEVVVMPDLGTMMKW